MRKFLTAVVIFLQLTVPVYAVENNIFGIHLAVANLDDLKSAAQLVNGEKGEWGYVTLVIQENDRDLNKWQGVFDQLRVLKLIPIIRIATIPEGDRWRRPSKEDSGQWVDFLNRLNWVVKERYVVIFNEPNHAAEWGGETNPEHYAEVAAEFAKKLKERNNDFRVMLAGFDAAAPSQAPRYEDEAIYLDRVLAKVPDIFNYIDALSSHSYPNPGFAGSPYASGRNSIRNYEWELEYLRSKGISKDLPVFITETGWNRRSSTPEDFVAAFSHWSTDSRVQAVTPFVLNYQTEPFLQFSWQKQGSRDFHPQYFAVKNMEKRRGSPEQIERGVVQAQLPRDLLVDSNYHFQFRLRNTGQAIWDASEGYELRIETESGDILDYFFSDIHEIKPNEDDLMDLYIKLGEKSIPQNAQIVLYKKGKKLPVTYDWNFLVTPLPRLVTKVSLFPRIRAKAEREFEIQIFDANEQLVYKKSGLKRTKGTVTIDAVHNVFLGGKYRVVILSDLYLPRQAHVVFKKGVNEASFRPMLPLDLNIDGRFDLEDLQALILNPLRLGLLLP